MSKRWPNTLFWQRVEAALRSIYGKSWRRSGEALFNIPRGQLRFVLGRRLSKLDVQRVR